MSRRLLTMFPLGAALLLSVGSAAPRSDLPMVDCLVLTGYGRVQGLVQGAACSFLGIPYAAPPVGANRWRPPRPAVPWAPNVLTVTTAPPNCAALQGTAIIGQEDCLRLNLWMPN